MTAPTTLVRLVEALERLPGIGPRTAQRLAHHLLRTPEDEAIGLADAIRAARQRIRPCPRCRAPSEQQPCPVCADPARDPTLLMVVETARDMEAVEATGRYRGLYHVLGGRLSALDAGATVDLALLARRAGDGVVTEVCVATNADLEGEGTALEVARALAAAGVRVTRLARGLPTGGHIEHQSPAVLADAYEGRRALE